MGSNGRVRSRGVAWEDLHFSPRMDGWLAGWMDGRVGGCPYGWLYACVIMAVPWNSLSGLLVAGWAWMWVCVRLFVDMYDRGYHACDLAGGL